LVQSSKGTLYGVLCCGDNTGIFQINSAGKYKLLQQTPQGALPATLLVVGSDGSIYGLITGSGYPGSVFAITPQGKTIFSEELNCATVGCEPLSLIEATNGNFYGLNFSGGTVPTGDNANGTVFKVATKRK